VVYLGFEYQYILNHFRFKDPKIKFLRHNENLVYQVTDQNKVYLLRIHQPIEGFTLSLHQRHFPFEVYIKSEMEILEYLNKHSPITVQAPVKTKDGHLLTFLNDGTPVSVLTWIEGQALNEEMCNKDIAYNIGQMVGKMHLNLSDLKGYERYCYDQELVQKMMVEINTAYQKEHLTKDQRELIIQSLEFVEKQMNLLDQSKEEKVLVHYDLGLSNLIIKDDKISPIDFSLCGYGYYQMDVAATAISFKDPEHRKATIKCFEDTVGIKVKIPLVETFFAFSLLLYITFQHEKASKESWFEKAMQRWEKTIFKPLLQGKPFLFNL